MVTRLLESIQARPHLSEEDAPRTSGAVELLVTFSLARTRVRRSPLSARGVGHATGGGAAE